MRLPDLAASDTMASSEAINRYIEHHFGYSLAQLLAPIGDDPVGESVRHNGVYFQIKEARKEDDANLPQGVWTHELKTADWDQVAKTALEALCFKSKDLQLGVWLMESNINRYGFAGVAPAAVLLRALCETFWDTMHPQMLDGDIEFRTNPINWINEKLSLRLRLVPMTSTQFDGDELSWDDWENAQRFEQLQRQHQGQVNWEGASSDTFKQHLAATPKAFLMALIGHLEDAGRAIDELMNWFDAKCGDNSPSLTEITHLLQQVHSMSATELSRRGVYLTANTQSDEADGCEAGGQSAGGQGGDGHGGAVNRGKIHSRADAFARLLEAGEFLMQDDPHSPVPYMVYTACAWGEKAAPDLYQEIFLNKGGQLNIFEIMGLALHDKSTDSRE